MAMPHLSDPTLGTNGPLASAWRAGHTAHLHRAHCEYGWNGHRCSKDAIPACRARDGSVDSCVVRKVLLTRTHCILATHGYRLYTCGCRCLTASAYASASQPAPLRRISASHTPSRCAPQLGYGHTPHPCSAWQRPLYLLGLGTRLAAQASSLPRARMGQPGAKLSHCPRLPVLAASQVAKSTGLHPCRHPTPAVSAVFFAGPWRGSASLPAPLPRLHSPRCTGRVCSSARRLNGRCAGSSSSSSSSRPNGRVGGRRRRRSR